MAQDVLKSDSLLFTTLNAMVQNVKRLKNRKKGKKMMDEEEFLYEQTEKKYRSSKKTKRDKPPHRKWEE